MKFDFHVLIVVGARPQIMKAAALARAIEEDRRCSFDIVHSGQHYDDDLSDQFFREFQLKAPKYQFHIGSKSHNVFMGEFLIAFDPILEEVQPDIVIVVGDTNTTSAAAIATAKRNIPLAHVEAGLREWDKSIPEEVNKLLTDAVSDIYFSPTITGAENLMKQGIEENVYITGDITLDLVASDKFLWSEAQTKDHFQLEGSYCLLTCHRAATTDDKSLLQEIVMATKTIDLPIIWPLHPRTKKALEQYGFISLVGENVRLIDPINFTETQSLIRHAKCVITDSGGIIKEAYFHSTPAIIIDNQTEWVETVEEGWNIIAGPDCEKIIHAYHSISIPSENKKSLGNGTAGKLIIEEIVHYLKKR